jgi:ribonuclease VapC
MSIVNVAEVLSRFAEAGSDPIFVRNTIEALGCDIVPISMDQTVMVAQLRPRTTPAGLSLGDRASLALAIERDCPVMTADRNWAKLNIGVPVHLIR